MLAEAILKLFPNASFGIKDNEIVDWKDDAPQPTIAELQPTMDALEQEEQFNTIKNGLEDAISQHIQFKIDEYNKANGLSFKDIDSLMKYTRSTKYPHYRFVTKTLSWNIDVWEFARNVMSEVTAGTRAIPTAEELITALPKLVY